MPTELKYHEATADAIAKIFKPYVEVVIHNTDTKRIHYIANCFSGRAVGSPSSFSGTSVKELDTQNPVGPYEKINWNGRELKSISSVLRSGTGDMIGLLCINIDISAFSRIERAISNFIGEDATIEQPDVLFKQDWHEKINLFVVKWARSHDLSIEKMSKENQKRLIKDLVHNGAFVGKNVAQYVASILNIGRATVYKYLKEIKDESK